MSNELGGSRDRRSLVHKMDDGEDDNSMAVALLAGDNEAESPVKMSDEVHGLNMLKEKGTHLATPLHT